MWPLRKRYARRLVGVSWHTCICIFVCFHPVSIEICQINYFEVEVEVEYVPYCFSRSYVQFQGHKGRTSIWLWFEHFWVITPFWIHSWLWNETHSMREVPYLFFFFFRSHVKFQGHTDWKIELDLIWARLQGRFQLSNPSDLPWHDSFVGSLINFIGDFVCTWKLRRNWLIFFQIWYIGVFRWPLD